MQTIARDTALGDITNRHQLNPDAKPFVPLRFNKLQPCFPAAAQAAVKALMPLHLNDWVLPAYSRSAISASAYRKLAVSEEAHVRMEPRCCVCAQRAASVEGLREQNGSEDAPSPAETVAG